MADWTHKNMACVATYNILGNETLLNQFVRSGLPFEAAGAIKLSSLPYYPKFGAGEDTIEGMAAQMSRYFFKYLVTLYTRMKEDAGMVVEDMLAGFKALFMDTSATVADLAALADKYLKFAGE